MSNAQIKSSSHPAVVFLNLGTPTEPTPRAVGRYLREFLLDPFVLQMSAIGRWLLVCLIIVPFRKYKSAKLYKKIWTKAGSPLFVYTQAIAEKMRDNSYDTYFCFRYGRPSIADVLRQTGGASEILFVPLYPQIADSSTTTSLEKLREDWQHLGGSTLQRLRWIQSYHLAPFYIESLAEILRPELFGAPFDHIVFSFHSLPESHLVSHDVRCGECLERGHCISKAPTCYHNQCEQTAERLREVLEIPREKMSVSYQSRLGRQKWITPATEGTLIRLAREGKRRVLLFAPGFVCDCLETLEELDYELRVKFQNAGGLELVRPLCLNDREFFIEKMKAFVQEQLTREGDPNQIILNSPKEI